MTDCSVPGEIKIIARPEAGLIKTAWIDDFLRRVLDEAGSRSARLTVVLAGDDEVRHLNHRFRGKDRTTDILSFPADGAVSPGELGEIIIAVGKARRQAGQGHHTLAIELRYLMIHGVLHLMGMDHETDDGEMDAEERRIRERLRQDLTPGHRSPAGMDA